MIDDTTSEPRRADLWKDKEQYSGGSAEAEYKEFQQLARGIMQIQSKVRKRVSRHGVPHPIQRAFHAKATLAVDDAELRFNDDLSADLRVGFAQPGAGVSHDRALLERGRQRQARFRAGLARHRITDPGRRQHVTRFAGHQLSRFARPECPPVRGVRESDCGRSHFNGSRARAPGETVRNPRDRPHAGQRPNRAQTAGRQRRDPDVLEPRRADVGAGAGRAVFAAPSARRAAGSKTIQDRPELPVHRGGPAPRNGDIRFELCIQRYVNDQVTPIEDTAVEWKETHSPAEPVATLTIKQTDITSTDAQARAAAIEHLAFNPWNTTEDFRPLGNLNRARKAAYDASAAHRSQTRWQHRNTLPQRRASARSPGGIFSVVNRRIPWHRLPLHFALLNLDVFRRELRDRNLIRHRATRGATAGTAGATADPGGRSRRPHRRRTLQRSIGAGDGSRRRTVRTQSQTGLPSGLFSMSPIRSW